MPSNMIVSYDLHRGRTLSGEDYEPIERAILAVDPNALKLLYTVWLIVTDWPVSFVHQHLLNTLTTDDRLLVVDATVNYYGAWLDAPITQALERKWYRPLPYQL